MLVVWILQLLLEVLNDERWPLGLCEVQGTSVVAVLDSVNPNEVNLALVLRGDWLKRLNVLLVLLVGGVNEKVRERLGARRVSLVVLRTDLVKEGYGEVANPVLEVLDLRAGDGIGVNHLRLVERPEDSNSRGSNTSGSRDVSISGKTEEVVIAVLVRGRAELRGRRVGGRGEEGDNDELVSLLELLKVLLGNLGYGGERLPVSRFCQI